MTSRSDVSIHKILLALDPSLQGSGTLQAAVELAAGLGAQLEGIFIEDTELLNVAGLPFASEFDPSFGTVRRLDSSMMERSLRGQAQRVRQAFAEAADALQVRWAFQVTRGSIAAELLAAALQADLLVLGAASTGTVYRRRSRVDPAAREVLTRASCSVAVLGHAATQGTAVVVLVDRWPEARRSLEVAARIAARGKEPVTVLLPPASPEETRQIEDEIEGLLGPHGSGWRSRRLEAPTAESLLRATEDARAKCLVLRAGTGILTQDALDRLVTASSCSVVLIR